MRNLKGLLSALLLLVFIAPCAEAADITLRFAGQFPDGHYATKLMRDIAGGVNQRTNGRIAIEVYPANKLGDYTLVYEDLMKGRVDMALITNSGQFDPRLELPNLNVFPSYESAAKDFAPDSWLAKRISEYNTRLGVKFLGFHIEGMTGIASTKKIKNPLDPNSNKGVLARVPLTTVYPEIIRSQGYRTVSLPYAGLAAAVHEDSCDAVTGVSTGAAATDLAGVVKYWYNLNYTIETLSYLMSADTWDKLREDDLAIIYSEVAKASKRSLETARQNDEMNLERMKKNGIKVFTYTEKELAPAREAVLEHMKVLEPTIGKGLMEDALKHFEKGKAK